MAGLALYGMKKGSKDKFVVESKELGVDSHELIKASLSGHVHILRIFCETSARMF